MPDLTPEQRARQQIDAQLVACGWVVQDYKSCRLLRRSRHRAARSSAQDWPVRLPAARRPQGRRRDRSQEGRHHALRPSPSSRRATPTSLPDFLAAGLTGTLPFLYESTGVETFFRDERDPAPALAPRLRLPSPRDARRVGRRAGHAARPAGSDARRRIRSPRTACATARSKPSPASKQSFAEDRPRALIQMATGAGKTFTACAFTYRLIKYAGAAASCSSWTAPISASRRATSSTGSARRTPAASSPSSTTSSTSPRRTSTTSAASPSAPSSGSTRCCAAKNSPKTWTKSPAPNSPPRSAARAPRDVAYNPDRPHRDVRLHRHRRMPPLHLQSLAAGARILRRLPHRPHRHAGAADHRLLQPEPRHRIQPRARRRRWRERRLRRLSHQNPGHRAGRQGREGLSHRPPQQGLAQGAAGSARRRSRLHARRPRPLRRRARPDPHRPAHATATSCSPSCSPAARSCPRRSSSPRTTPTPRTSSTSAAKCSARATTSARRSPTRPSTPSPASPRSRETHPGIPPLAARSASPSPWT